jgi:integrator complex subunit 9
LFDAKDISTFTSIHYGLSNVMRTPCVVFTGHPSLRFGDAVHFMELWGGSALNSVIFTEPDFFFLDALAPFQPLAMKAFNCPIDTSLSFSQASKLVRDLAPSHLVTSRQYTVPPTLFPHRQDLTIDSSFLPIIVQSADVINLPIRRKFERVEMAPNLAMRLAPKEMQPGVGIAMVTGLLVANDNRYVLQDAVLTKAAQNGSNSSSDPAGVETGVPGAVPGVAPVIGSPVARCCYGPLDILDFISRLKQVHSAVIHEYTGPAVYCVIFNFSQP